MTWVVAAAAAGAPGRLIVLALAVLAPAHAATVRSNHDPETALEAQLEAQLESVQAQLDAPKKTVAALGEHTALHTSSGRARARTSSAGRLRRRDADRTEPADVMAQSTSGGSDEIDCSSVDPKDRYTCLKDNQAAKAAAKPKRDDWDPNLDEFAVKSEATLGEAKPFLETGNRESGSTSYITPTQLEHMQPYPGIDYLGFGYDLIHGNPDGDAKFGSGKLDPGFRQPIRSMDYKAGWLTRDGLYKVPKGAYATPLKTCTRSMEYTDVASASSYADSLAMDASVEARYKGWGSSMSFQASFGFKKTKNEDKQTSDYRFMTKSFCNKYFAAWLEKVPEPDDITPQFAWAALKALDSVPVPDEDLSRLDDAAAIAAVAAAIKAKPKAATAAREIWYKLFNTYGTHIITKLTLGGKVIFTKFVTKDAVSSAAGLDANADMGPCCAHAPHRL